MSHDRDRWGALRRDLRSLSEESTGPLPEKIGRYSILNEISRAGSSIVYAARDPELGRKVALKVLREERAVPDFLRRFQREGAIAASLRHPNIITIYEVGVWRSRGDRDLPFIAMEYLEGGTLADKKRAPAEAAGLLAAIADAVEHAHGAGVIHRDLKPANVLLDPGGKPVVTDFGLAKSADLNSALTLEGSILGTPQYMAPEQVRGEHARVDARTDVYALGALLYELLAGVPPFTDPSTAALFEKILHAEPRRLSELPRDLEAIALKALEKDPARRYGSAGEFARELRSFLAGEPVRARGPSSVRRILRKSMRGRPLAVGVAALLIAGLALAASLRRSSRAREEFAQAVRWEAEGQILKARDGFRAVLEAAPEHEEARAGFDRTDAEIRTKAAAEAAMPPLSGSRSWVELGTSASPGGVSNTPGESCQPAVAVDAQGRITVAWRDREKGSDEILLRRWDGTGWKELAGSATGGGVSNTVGESRFPSVAIDLEGNPVVAWDDAAETPSRILVRRWTGTAWGAYGISPVASGPRHAPRGAPSLAIDPEGRPVVAWQEEVEGRYQIYLRRWDGAVWSELGGSASGGGVSRSERNSHYAALAVDRAGRPVVAWLSEGDPECAVEVRRWDGEAWKDLDSRGLAARVPARPHEQFREAMALDPSDLPILAWLGQKDGQGQVFLKRWSGTAWVELGASGSGLGVSASPGIHQSVSVTVDGRGHPAVAWSDNGSGSFEVYLRRWDGSSWVELAGSGTGAGVSRTWGNSWFPSVRLDPSGNPVVAWVDGDEGNNEIFLRRFRGDPPARLRQLRRTGSTALPRGTAIPEPGLLISARLTSSVPGATVRLEVEVVPADQPFTGRPTAQGEPVPPGSAATLSLEGLPPGPKRWQARAVDSFGMASDWVSYGADGGPDFRIDSPR